MPNAVSKVALSASTQGEGVKIVATSTPGTLIHTTGTAALSTTTDEVWIYAFNSNTVAEVLTLEYGGAAAPDQNIVVTIPPTSGLILVVPGLIIAGSGTVAATIKGFTTDANKVVVYGYANRITP